MTAEFTREDADRYLLTRKGVVDFVNRNVTEKEVSNWVDRGLISYETVARPLRARRLFSFRSILEAETIGHIKRCGSPIEVGAKLAQIATKRMEELLDRPGGLDFEELNWNPYSFDQFFYSVVASKDGYSVQGVFVSPMQPLLLIDDPDHGWLGLERRLLRIDYLVTRLADQFRSTILEEPWFHEKIGRIEDST